MANGAPALYERYKRFKAELEFRQKEWRENPHPLNARITEIKKGGSGATPLTKIRD